MRELYLKLYLLVQGGRLDDALGLLKNYGFEYPEEVLGAIEEAVYGDRYNRSWGVSETPLWPQ